jgi:pilus assembly protein TadC
MSDQTSIADSDTSEELYAVMRAVKSIISKTDIDSVVLSAIVGELSATTVQRRLRISLANQRLPIRLRLLLVFMGIVLSLGFLLVPVGNLWIHLLMTTTLAMSVHLLSLIIDDLDHPFYGV